jgi:hypothetical protein
MSVCPSHARLVVRLRVQSVRQITGVITEDCNVLWGFQWQSIIDVLQKNDASSSELADKFLVITANIDARLVVVSEVVQIRRGCSLSVQIVDRV